VYADTVLQAAARYGRVVSDQLPPVPSQLLACDLQLPVRVSNFETL
jgi:hypothetical protein